MGPAQRSAEHDRSRDVTVARASRPTPDEPHTSRPEAAQSEADREMPDVAAPDTAMPRIIRNHRRFALSEVTLDGDPVGGATIDAWQNAAGADFWSARVLMVPTDERAVGALAGRTRDGRVLRGRVERGATGPAPKPRGAALIEWHGVGVLRADVHAEGGRATD
jgi:hypothetical protein